MADIDIIGLIERRLGISLQQLDQLSASEKGYTLDKDGFVEGLSIYGFEVQYLKDIFDLLARFTRLRVLDLVRNQICDISFLRPLTALEELNLSSNQIVDITPLSNLTGLTHLCLNNNQIVDLGPLQDLIELQSLDLFYNQIKDISPLRPLINLQTVFLSHNQIEALPEWVTEFDFDVVYEQTSFRHMLNVYQNPLKLPPLEIIKQGKGAIHNYFEQIRKQGHAQVFEAKVMLVGEPGAGKSTLLRKLFDRNYPVPSPHQKSTIGIDVRQNWHFETHVKEKGKAHIWDFGGQQIQYMLHQFFLTSDCVYILMAEKRRELTNFDYWLNIINLLGKNSPVLVLFNEINFDSVTSFIYDEKKYRDLFPNLDIQRLDVNFAEIDDGRFDVLQHNLKQKLSKLDHMGEEVPARWIDIRQALEALRHKKHIQISEYFDICQKFGVDEEPDQMLILKYFHLLGLVLHFNDDDNLCDTLFLDPNWTVDAVYSVLSNSLVEQCYGILTKADIERAWRDKGYDFIERTKLLQLMLKDNFELCYRLNASEDKYIMPSLLPAKKPDYPWPQEDNLQFRFQYPFMPKGIVSRLIVRLNYYVNEQKVWREGAVFDHEDAHAEVVEERTVKEGLKIISIRLWGKASTRKNLLTLVREEIRSIQASSYSHLPFLEMVPCCCSHCKSANTPYFFDYDSIENYLQKGKTTIDCRISTDTVGIADLVGTVFNVEEIESRVRNMSEQNQSNIQINLSNIGNSTNTVEQKVEQSAELTATQQQSVAMEVKTMLGLFNNLKEDIIDEIDIELDDPKEVKRITNELNKTAKAFEQLEQQAENQTPELDAATRSRLGEFVDNLADEDSRLNKGLALVNKGKDKLQSMGRIYNKLAPYFTLPSIPPILLNEPE